MNILILGGNGFLGWPTSIYLSKRGHNITIVDNFYKDKICKKINISALYEVPELNERIKIWKNLNGNQIKFYNFDLKDPKNNPEIGYNCSFNRRWPFKLVEDEDPEDWEISDLNKMEL